MWPRCIRACLYTLALLLIYLFVLVQLFDVPIIHARSDLALSVHWYVSYASALLMLFLTLLIFDATLLCLLFVKKLARARTEWPAATLELSRGRLGLQTNVIHEWADLDFVAKRTRCIGFLVYYPFVLIALQIVSRSATFADYAPSAPHIIHLVLHSGLLVCLALTLPCQRLRAEGRRAPLNK